MNRHAYFNKESDDQSSCLRSLACVTAALKVYQCHAVGAKFACASCCLPRTSRCGGWPRKRDERPLSVGHKLRRRCGARQCRSWRWCGCWRRRQRTELERRWTCQRHMTQLPLRSIGHGFQDTEEDTTLNFGISYQIDVPTVGTSCSRCRDFICFMAGWSSSQQLGLGLRLLWWRAYMLCRSRRWRGRRTRS